MTSNSQYTQFVHIAEAAVATVKDPELRKIAFQRVLDDLLSKRRRWLVPKTPDLKARNTRPHIPQRVSLLKK